MKPHIRRFQDDSGRWWGMFAFRDDPTWMIRAHTFRGLIREIWKFDRLRRVIQ